jgi:hypothetical protein
VLASISNVATAWATLAAAGATVLLAVFTWRLARQAKAAIGQDAQMLKAAQDQGEKIAEQAKATKAQADAVEAQAKAASEQLALAQQTLGLSVAPLLSVGDGMPTSSGGRIVARMPPLIVRAADYELNASLEVLNIGQGLAIIRPGESKIVGWVGERSTFPNELMSYTSPTADRPILRPGEQVGLTYMIDIRRYPGATVTSITHGQNAAPQFFLDVVYGPVLADADLTRARFHAQRDPDTNGWEVMGIDYFTPPSATAPWPWVRFH